jgi:hypothetical protein
MNMKTEQIGHKLYRIVPENADTFTCVMDGHEIELQIVCEVVDLYEAGILETEGRSLGADFYILPKMHELCDGFIGNLNLPEDIDGPAVYDVMSYIGGVPLRLGSEVDIPDEIDHGRSDKFDGAPLFDSMEGVEDYIKLVAENEAPAVATMVGFYLDKRVNRIGTTGWDFLRSMCFTGDSPYQI